MKNVLAEFKEFAMKGNVMDLAVGVVIGTAFNKIITSLVNDVVMPPIGMILGKVDFANLFINLSGKDFATLADAQKAGAATINYGIFINTVIGFVITAWAVFIMVRILNRMRNAPEKVPTQRPCPFCTKDIPLHAKRCPECTSEVDVPQRK